MTKLPAVDGSLLTGIKHVSEDNTLEALFVKGDESIDGSLKIIPTSDGGGFRFEAKSGGVWNLAPIEIAAATIHIGSDLSLSGAGEWVETRSKSTDQKALLAHVNFDDEGTQIAHSPVLGKKIIKFIAQPDESEEVIGKVLTGEIVSPITGLRTKLYLKTGSVGATSEVLYTVRRGGSEGPIFWQRNLPIDLMREPNEEFEIDFLGFVESVQGEIIHSEASSRNPISLKTNSSGVWLAAIDVYPLSQEDIILDDQVLTNELDLVFQNNGGFITNDQFAD